MKNEKIKLGLLLFAIGITGVFSILTMEINIPEDAKAVLLLQFTEEQIKWLTLINPTFFLIVTLFFGVRLHETVKLDVPILKGLINKEKQFDLPSIIKAGVVGGVVSGVLLSIISLLFSPLLPHEFIALGEKVKPSIAARFLYGGITEEILLRFGIMTIITWIGFKFSKALTSKVYWIAIIVAALVFGLGHFPIVFQTLESPSTLLLMYVLFANSIGGVVFGWLYWKKGLESAFVAHAVTHVVFVIFELFQ